ncbi:hypothetical protein ACC668_33115 [Rhizobium ruizarguesonis]
MFPTIGEKVLFVDQDGEIYVALPGQDAQRLTREQAEIWYTCDGATSIPELVAELARIREQPVQDTLETVLNFLSYYSRIGFIEFCSEREFEDVMKNRFDKWGTIREADD